MASERKPETPLPTRFAPAERESPETISRQAQSISKSALVARLLNSVPVLVMIVNQRRQIVYANKACIRFLGLEDAACLHGVRPGEAVGCEHAFETDGGCGTTEFCRTCGGVMAMMASLNNESRAEECRVRREVGGEALDLHVLGTPFEIGGERFAVLSITDISHEKRRRALERIFFHDLLNDAGALQGLADLLQEASPEEAREYGDLIVQVTGKLIEEIQSQRALSLAEAGELKVCRSVFDCRTFLTELVVSYRNHAVADGRQLQITGIPENLTILSDRLLLSRVVGNMIKNALEASEAGETVTVSCRKCDNEVRFSVHNPHFMPRDVQLQVFNRSFSTKGADRGLGTYSMKLLAENYLGGRVFFETSEESGTTFHACCALELCSE